MHLRITLRSMIHGFANHATNGWKIYVPIKIANFAKKDQLSQIV